MVGEGLRGDVTTDVIPKLVLSIGSFFVAPAERLGTRLGEIYSNEKTKIYLTCDTQHPTTHCERGPCLLK